MRDGLPLGCLSPHTLYTTRCSSPAPSLAPLLCLFVPVCSPRPLTGVRSGVAWCVCAGAVEASIDPRPPAFPLGGAHVCTLRQGVALLYGPSICTRFVQMDLRRSQVLRLFPTPEFGALWVAGEPLRDRRDACLPRWTVCPTRTPSLGTNRSTCRGECSVSGPLATALGRCHHGPLANGPRRIPPYCVCSGGADTVTGGGQANS